MQKKRNFACSEMRKKHVHAICEQNVECLNTKPLGEYNNH